MQTTVMLDSERWTSFCEQTFQHLQHIDEMEWRIIDSRHGGKVYVSYFEKCPVSYYSAAGFDRNPEELVLRDMMDALRSRAENMPLLNGEDHNRWQYPKKNYTNWDDFDKDICGCGEDQVCGGCKQWVQK